MRGKKSGCSVPNPICMNHSDMKKDQQKATEIYKQRGGQNFEHPCFPLEML